MPDSLNEKLSKIDKTSLAFSIIMPVYNVEKYVSQAIESVLSQSYRNFELIIVNDCSPDNSLSICESYAEKDKRIHIISLSQNGGLSNARNVGMQSMRGDYVLFLDSDDWWEPNLLETVSRVVEKTHPEMVFFGYADEWYSLEDKHLSTQLRVPHGAEVYGSNQAALQVSVMLQRQSNDMYAWSSNKAISTSYMKKESLCFMKVPLSEDKEFMGRLWDDITSVVVIPELLLHYRRKKTGSLRSKYQPRFYEIHKGIWDYRFDQLKRAHLLDEAAILLNTQFLQFVYLTIQMMCYPQSDQHLSEQMKFIKNVNKDMYWQEIRSKDLDASLTFKVMNFLLVNKINIGVLLLGHAIYFIKMHCFWLWRHLR